VVVVNSEQEVSIVLATCNKWVRVHPF
jgi:hypothetical protein